MFFIGFLNVMGPWYFSAMDENDGFFFSFSLQCHLMVLSSCHGGLCVSLCAWWHRDNQILIFYLQNHHSECICWPNFLYPSLTCFLYLCTPFFILISPLSPRQSIFLPPLFPLPHPSFSPSPTLLKLRSNWLTIFY